VKPEDDPGNSALPCHPISPDKESPSFEKRAEYLSTFIFLVQIKDRLLQEIFYCASSAV
jgi:hypothetical protein